MAILSKQSLKSQIDTLFPDNNSGEITPQDLRTYLENILDSNNLQRVETSVLLAPSETLTVADIDENKSYILGNIGQVITLPELEADIDTIQTRFIKFQNVLTTFAPSGSDQIFGPTQIDRDGIITVVATSQGWGVLFQAFAESNFTGLTDTPNSYDGEAGKQVVVNMAEDALEFVERQSRVIQVTCGAKKPKADEYLEWMNDQDSDNAGYCVPKSGSIVAASINRTDDDDSVVQVLHPGGSVDLFTTEQQSVYDPLPGGPIAVSAGNRIRARVKNGENRIDNVLLALLIEIN